MKNSTAACRDFCSLGAHAAAGIEYQPDGKRRIFGREILNLLFDLVFEETEMLFLKTGDEAIQGIGDGDIDLDQGGVDAEAAGALFETPGAVFFGRLGSGRDGDFVIVG